MRTNLYSVYDTIAGVFNKPFVEHNDDTAKRAFQASASEQPHLADYSLYHLGYYDDTTGEIIPVDPLKIMSGLDIKGKITSITPEMQRKDLEKTA